MKNNEIDILTDIVAKLNMQLLENSKAMLKQATILEELATLYAKQAIQLNQLEKRFEELKNYVAKEDK